MAPLLRVTLGVFLCASILAGSPPSSKVSTDEALLGFLCGDFDVIGRLGGSGVPYAGGLTIRRDGRDLKIVRTIAGRAVVARGRIEEALSDRVPVLRIFFELPADPRLGRKAAIKMEGLFLWRSDLDNSPRFTGKLWERGKEVSSPHLEAWFPSATR